MSEIGTGTGPGACALPRGLWAVASELTGVDAARTWAEGAAGTEAWSFRRPQGTERESLSMLRVLRARAPWLAVHGRADQAILAKANAVIAGHGSLPLATLRSLAPGLVAGASTHDQAELEAARAGGAHFVFFGPVWETPAKKGLLAARGSSALREICRQGLPVIAIGGVLEPEQVRTCHEAGAHGVAVLRAARDAGRLAELVAAWHQGSGESGVRDA